MRDPVAFLLFVSLLAIVFPKGNQGDNQEELKDTPTNLYLDQLEILEKYNKASIIWSDILDQHKDDYIDKEEFSFHFKPEYVEYAFMHYDDDGDGKLNFEDYRKAYLEFDNVCANLKCL